MVKAEDLQAVRHDMDCCIVAIAGQVARLRGDHALTQALIERSQAQLSASRKLLGQPESDASSARTAVAGFRAEALKKVQRHISDTETHIARQMILLEHLSSRGYDEASAMRLLEVLEFALKTYKAELRSFR